MTAEYNANLSGQVALITGAGHRLGRAMAQQLHRAGADIIIHYRQSREGAEALATELNEARADSATSLAADLLDGEQIRSLAELASGWKGRLDILINNASSFYPTPVEQLDAAAFDDLIGSNLRAPALLTTALAPALKQSGGCVINLIDIHHQRPMPGFAAYNAAKSGLAGLTRSLALELAPEVRVNGIAPGAILWPEGESDEHQQKILQKIPLARCGRPEDIAQTALFLATAPYISGQIIAVDGGRSLNI
ncbi:MAG: pteridine reductase [Pseudomonadota bacterium]